jgi:putative methyltransferase (TIGR04325 family)
VRARRQQRQLDDDEYQAAQRAARDDAERQRRVRALQAKSWDDACRRAEAGGYHTKGLNRFRVARARHRIADGSLLLGNVLALVAHLVGKREVAVTDFGGAAGELGRDFLLSWPEARYSVVENPRLVGLMQQERPTNGLTFATDMPGQCDIFYCSGALQYLAEPLDIWVQGLQSARHAAVLRRNHFAAAEEFDLQQSHLFENGNGPLPPGFADFTLTYPRRTLIEDQVHALARHHGFRCIANLDDCEHPPGEQYSRQLVFWRDQALTPDARPLWARLSHAFTGRSL